MTSETLQMLNLSPIPELSEMELSTMFEQLSGVSDPNGEITDRNVEDILREAEELIDSISNKPNSAKYNENDFKPSNDDKFDDSESVNDVLNLSAYSEDESKRSDSNKNERDSQGDLSSRSSKSVTNHIRLTLDSLRECSEKIENQVRNSPHKAEDSSDLSSIKTLKNVGEDELKSFKGSSEESEKLADNKVKKCLKTVKKKEPVKGLSLNDSVKTLNCFERLYRGKSARPRIDYKKLKMNEKMGNDKKMVAGKVVKTMNPSIYKDRQLKKCNSEVLVRKSKVCSGRVDKNFSESLTDEEISFEKCLKLLNEDSQSSSDVTFNQIDVAEKILKQYTSTFSALQVEVEDLKMQLKQNSARFSSSNNTSPKVCSEENLIKALKEENSRLFKEIEEIKGQLKSSGNGDESGREKAETIEKLRLEVENLRRSLITAYSENNGILRLEEQFSLLKKKYDQQIGHLEEENQKLKNLVDCDRVKVADQKTKSEAATQTEPRKDMMRSISLENCRSPARKLISSNSCESVDVATSPIRSWPYRMDKELCSVSVQCKGDSDGLDDQATRPQSDSHLLREFRRSDNKENVAKKATGKGNPVLGQALWKQKKISEHESQLMVSLRVLHSEITVKDRENKKLRNELEVLKNQTKRLTGGGVKQKKNCSIGTQTIGFGTKIQDTYNPAMFQVSRELEDENERLKMRTSELEKIIEQLKDKRVHDLQILQKLHEEEIEKLASRLNTQTALTNHLHSLLTNR